MPLSDLDNSTTISGIAADVGTGSASGVHGSGAQRRRAVAASECGVDPLAACNLVPPWTDPLCAFRGTLARFGPL